MLLHLAQWHARPHAAPARRSRPPARRQCRSRVDRTVAWQELEEVYVTLEAEREGEQQQRLGAGRPRSQHSARAVAESQAPGNSKADARQAAAAASAQRRTLVEAIFAGGGTLRTEWAAAANVSVPELRRELTEGRLARERIVTSNMGLVGSLVIKLRRKSGGRVDLGITEADLMQEVRAPAT